MDKPTIELYTDGSADPNPGKGGYGVILKWGTYQKEFSEGFTQTTNNRMEILGVIAGLEKLKQESIVHLYSDSQYVIRAIEENWIGKWKAKGWHRTKTQKALNADLWRRLDELLGQHEVHTHWIKGHNGHPMNERCDQLAKTARESSELSIDEGYDNGETEVNGTQMELFPI